ncbi:MAG TPA: hypothetical protein VGJ60_06360, partial [Chloroflexota bacterium]
MVDLQAGSQQRGAGRDGGQVWPRLDLPEVGSDQWLGTAEETLLDVDAEGEPGSLALDQHRVEQLVVAG